MTTARTMCPMNCHPTLCGMLVDVEEGRLVTLDRVDCVIDGLRVKRVGATTFEVVGAPTTRTQALASAQ